MFRIRLYIYLIIFYLLFCLSLYSQPGNYRVFFRDKGPIEFKHGTSLYDTTFKLFTERALNRRSKVLPVDSIINIEDAPVYMPYIDSCTDLGSELKLILRWENYIVVQCDSETIEIINKLNFVKNVQPTANKLVTLDYNNYSMFQSIFINDDNNIQIYENCNDLDYGPSLRQAQLLNVPILHSFGINGNGILIGFLDTGFRWKSQISLTNASVQSEYDFINNDSVTANDDLDSSGQDSHGTAVLSITGGFSQGNLIGIAPNAEFILSKTEILNKEMHIEEDNYASAIEWIESRGVDITSSSLGYFNFDLSDSSYKYEELNGNTTIVSKSVNRAVKRGVICITAAGNSGPFPRTIVSPGDADSAITVGAVQPDGITPASFSSRGPRVDGKIKPDISAMGVNVFAGTLDPSNPFGFGGGTSFATPLITGTVALLLQEFPELKPWEVRKLLKTSASLSNKPDDTLGYGIPDVFETMKKAGIIISPVSTYKLNQYQRIVVYIASASPLIKTELYIKFKDRQSFEKYILYPTVYKYQYTADIPLDRFSNDSANCYIKAEDLENDRRLPYIETDYITIEPNTRHIHCGIPSSQTEEFAKDKTDAYLYPSIIEDYRDFIELIVPLKTKSDIQIDLFDLLGNKVNSRHLTERETGISSTPVEITNLSIGSYFINVSYNGKIETIPFIIIRK
ncbi:MAG: S8 family peptidase [Ignavibacteriae bacterium]|nr:S8 family peptidase [Ignavibacteriota bacterium]